jgi:predicted PurR-regulated permease PerM
MEPVIVERRPADAAPEPHSLLREPPAELGAAMSHAATRAVLLAAVLLVAGLLFHALVTLVVVGVVTIIVAIVLSLVADPLERRGVPRPLGALAGVLLLLGVMAGVLALVVPTIVSEGARLIEKLPDVANDLGKQVGAVTGGEPAQAGDRIQRAFDHLSDDPTRFLGPLATFAGGLAGVISAVVLILIIAYYMAARPQPLIDGFLRLFPPQRREWVDSVLCRMREAWGGWLKGVAFDMVITAVLLYVGLSLVGLDFAFLFAVLSALLVVVPYFGAIAGGVPPVLIGFTESTELGLAVFVVYVIVQQIEGNVIVPVVMARVVKLHPAVIAIGVVVVSQLFGLIGLIVAVPLISATVILVEELWIIPMERRRSAFGSQPEIARAPGGRFQAEA